MIFGKIGSFHSVVYGCLLSMFMAGSSTVSARTVNPVLTAAELVTALGRSMVVVANHDGQPGKMTNARLVANLSRMLNEALGFINHFDDIQGTVSPALYNGGWLAYDTAVLLQYCSDNADESVLSEHIVSDPVFDDNIERITNVLLYDVLPLVETVTATVVAVTGLAEDADEYRTLRIRLQSITSLMRTLQLCFEHRGDAKANWYLGLLAIHVVVTVWEFFRDVKASSTSVPVGNNPIDPTATQAVTVLPVTKTIAGDTGSFSANTTDIDHAAPLHVVPDAGEPFAVIAARVEQQITRCEEGTARVAKGITQLTEGITQLEERMGMVEGEGLPQAVGGVVPHAGENRPGVKSEEKSASDAVVVSSLKPPQEQGATTAVVAKEPEAKAEVKIPVGHDEAKVASTAGAPVVRPVVVSTESVSTSANAGAVPLDRIAPGALLGQPFLGARQMLLSNQASGLEVEHKGAVPLLPESHSAPNLKQEQQASLAAPAGAAPRATTPTPSPSRLPSYLLRDFLLSGRVGGGAHHVPLDRLMKREDPFI